MYELSGIYYIIFTSDVLALGLGALVLATIKPWKNKEKFKRNIVLIVVYFIVLMGTIRDVSSIVHPDIISYQGEFISTNRTSRRASLLPFMRKYVFWNGEGKKQPFYLDSFSKDKIFSEELELGEEYIVYYEDYTNIIVGIEPVETDN